MLLAYDNILAFLDTLEQPQPPSDVEEAAMEYIRPKLSKDYVEYGERKQMQLTRFDGYDILEAIEFGAEWQKEQMMTNEEMKCALRMEYEKGVFDTKQQMLKDAVKGTVCKDKKCVWIELIPNALPDYEDIEPVKCVVMKEDKE